MQVLAQVISALSCERNWSAHGHSQPEVHRGLAPDATAAARLPTSRADKQSTILRIRRLDACSRMPGQASDEARAEQVRRVARGS